MKPSYERQIEEFLRSSIENTADNMYFEQQRHLVAAALEPELASFDDDANIRYRRRFLEV